MTIFVTGGTGYIGSHTVLELLKCGYNVVVADNFSNSKPEVLARLKRLTGKDFPFYNIDVRDKEKLSEVFLTNKIDIIIHFAGLKAVGESISVPLKYYANNLNSTIALCETMEKYGVHKIIFSSSATVYSGANKMPLTEDSAVGNCLNPYGWTKLMCEQILKDIASANADWSVALLRYFNPIGAHESGEIGEDPQGIPNNLMPYITQVASKRLEFLNIFGNDYDTVDGTGVRDYIHVMDLARGHVAAIKHINETTGVSVYNLGTGKGTSVLELVNSFEKVTGVSIPRKIAPRRHGDLAACYTSADKAKNELNWACEKTVIDAALDAWRWQSKNPMGY